MWMLLASIFYSWLLDNMLSVFLFIWILAGDIVGRCLTEVGRPKNATWSCRTKPEPSHPTLAFRITKPGDIYFYWIYLEDIKLILLHDVNGLLPAVRQPYNNSVLTYYGVNSVFENAIRAALVSRRQQRFWLAGFKRVQRPLLQVCAGWLQMIKDGQRR